MTLPYIYQFTHSILFPLSALTHSISLPCKMDGKEGQSVDTYFWHPVESISHQHRCSKFLMKSRIIWSNYDHDQRLKIQGYISLYVTEINDLHCMYFTSFAFHALHVISCGISRHFMSHFTSFHVIFHTFHCTHHTHRTHVTHVTHYAFREQHVFHALHHTLRHFMCHFISFHHEIS